MNLIKTSMLAMSALSLLALNQPSFAATTEEIARGNCNTCATTCDDTIKYCETKKDNRSNRDCDYCLARCINFLPNDS